MNPKHVGHSVHFIHFKTDCRDDHNGSETNFGEIIVASSVNPVPLPVHRWGKWI